MSEFDVKNIQGSMSVAELLEMLLLENKLLNNNMASTHERCTQLINKARDWRKKIIALGGEDPGEP